jgi:hypothetical protein
MAQEEVESKMMKRLLILSFLTAVVFLGNLTNVYSFDKNSLFYFFAIIGIFLNPVLPVLNLYMFSRLFRKEKSSTVYVAICVGNLILSVFSFDFWLRGCGNIFGV